MIHTNVLCFTPSSERTSTHHLNCAADTDHHAITNRSTRKEKVLIVDCRPRVNALANRASGKGGYEKAKHYPNTELEYLKIGNIHVMRK